MHAPPVRMFGATAEVTRAQVRDRPAVALQCGIDDSTWAIPHALKMKAAWWLATIESWAKKAAVLEEVQADPNSLARAGTGPVTPVRPPPGPRGTRECE